MPQTYGGAYGGYGGYGAGYGAHPYMDQTLITTQKQDATNALGNQAKLQSDMLKHQSTWVAQINF